MRGLLDKINAASPSGPTELDARVSGNGGCLPLLRVYYNSPEWVQNYRRFVLKSVHHDQLVRVLQYGRLQGKGSRIRPHIVDVKV
jgi:hypothetical protein